MRYVLIQLANLAFTLCVTVLAINAGNVFNIVAGCVSTGVCATFTVLTIIDARN